MIASKNLQIKQEADGKVTYVTKDNVTFTAVNAMTVNVGDTTINNDGLTIQNGPSITKGGLNAGNKVIGNVSKGVADNDAVNVNQLKEATSNITNNINNLANNTIALGGDNGTTTSAQALNKEGGLQFDVNGGNGISTTANGSSITVTAKPMVQQLRLMFQVILQRIQVMLLSHLMLILQMQPVMLSLQVK
ncbi:hypothetical protein BKK47_00580 [Rodentibacter mrazii]|uniref:Trimeric autotransporter adhesin YadA-like stalk domain-containing protein n=1 Tax=Rodentibacter mrazii TaxID=1908257 RepID=A0A1V3IKK8_9PAST|nr:hypothetical protein [Rodentibacter mrazii]OOF41625.1 hypothetical protein BKK47_00580 [Rodentibacter mrazii]